MFGALLRALPLIVIAHSASATVITQNDKAAQIIPVPGDIRVFEPLPVAPSFNTIPDLRDIRVFEPLPVAPSFNTVPDLRDIRVFEPLPVAPSFNTAPDLGDLRVFEPLPVAPAVNIDNPLWDEALGAGEHRPARGFIDLDILPDCGLAANPDGTVGRCFPEPQVAGGGAGGGGQVPAPGGLVMILAALAFIGRRRS